MTVTPLLLAWWFAAVPTPSDEASIPSNDGSFAEVQAAPPEGERVKPKLISPRMVEAAEAFVTLPLGTERWGVVDGRTYVFVVERHYHPPGYVGGPTGWHNGVTMYEIR